MARIWKVLKDECMVMANRWLDVINSSLERGTFPDKWNTSTKS